MPWPPVRITSSSPNRTALARRPNRRKDRSSRSRATNQPQFTFPTLKTGNKARNLYLGAVNGSTGGPYTLYASGITTSTYTAAVAAPSNSYAVAPPTINTTGLTYVDANGNTLKKPLELLRAAKDGNLEDAYRYLRQVIDDFNRGNPMSFMAAIDKLRHAHAVFAMLDTLCSEMGTLIDANAGTLGTAANGDRYAEGGPDLAMRIEAVTVCVDYADFLECTLPSIRAAVDDLVVVTAPADRRTRELCRREDVNAVVTTAMHDTAGGSAWGPQSTPGCGRCHYSDWALVDRRRYRAAAPPAPYPRSPRPRPRQAVRDRSRTLPGLGAGSPIQHGTASRSQLRSAVPAGFPGRGRISLPDQGYLPCGYFQLWNARATGYRDYPINAAGTARART